MHYAFMSAIGPRTRVETHLQARKTIQRRTVEVLGLVGARIAGSILRLLGLSLRKHLLEDVHCRDMNYEKQDRNKVRRELHDCDSSVWD